MPAIAEQSYLSRRVADFASDEISLSVSESKLVAELDERVGYALALNRALLNYSETSSSRVILGSQEHLAASEHIEDLLQSWLSTAKAISSALEGSSSREQLAPHMKALNDAISDVRITLSVPASRFVGREARIARDGLQRGKTTQELRLELQNRMGSLMPSNPCCASSLP